MNLFVLVSFLYIIVERLDQFRTSALYDCFIILIHSFSLFFLSSLFHFCFFFSLIFFVCFSFSLTIFPLSYDLFFCHNYIAPRKSFSLFLWIIADPSLCIVNKRNCKVIWNVHMLIMRVSTWPTVVSWPFNCIF